MTDRVPQCWYQFHIDHFNYYGNSKWWRFFPNNAASCHICPFFATSLSIAMIAANTRYFLPILCIHFIVKLVLKLRSSNNDGSPRGAAVGWSKKGADVEVEVVRWWPSQCPVWTRHLHLHTLHTPTTRQQRHRQIITSLATYLNAKYCIFSFL